jgi:antibiotic biosynthesis monooxygenase (ABM) superfamily enzyme
LFSALTDKGEISMASMLIQHQVKNYAEWRKVYDSVKALRASNGELSDQLFQDASDPNKLTILFKWNSLSNAQKWAQSPDLRAAMEKAGVLGAPTVTFLNEA